MPMRIHPKNVHKNSPQKTNSLRQNVFENSPKVSMRIHFFCSQKFTFYVHEKSAPRLFLVFFSIMCKLFTFKNSVCIVYSSLLAQMYSSKNRFSSEGFSNPSKWSLIKNSSSKWANIQPQGQFHHWSFRK